MTISRRKQGTCHVELCFLKTWNTGKLVIDLFDIERELKKRLDYPYKWGRRQSDSWDAKTDFIYHTGSFGALLDKTKNFSQELRDYAMNRWYNFWSAMAVEYIFSLHPGVVANKNKYDKWVDFTLNGISFDHKTSVFPKAYPKSLNDALNNKKDLIGWLYDRQSQEGRKHLKNRLFVLLFHKNGEHWKMKSEISFLKTVIDNYLRHFDKSKLQKLTLGKENIYSDIIWAVHC